MSELTDIRRILRELPVPEPAAGSDVYLKEREKALKKSKKKYDNYQKFLSSERSKQVDYLPIKLDIENVSRCNYRCTMCVVSDWKKGKRADDMALDSFKRLIDEQYGLLEIKLQGLGEPLLQGNDFFEMIQYARQQNIWVRVTTNSSLLHIKDNYKKLVDSDVNEIQMSIDGADKETYESIRRGSVFERVMENCKRINGYCDDKQVVRTKMWTVVQNNNKHQLSELVELAAMLGFKNQVFSLNLTDWGINDWKSINDKANVQDELSPDLLFSLIEQGEKLGVKVRFWSVNEKYDTEDKKKLCPWPFERAYIGSDLRISPCCYIGNPDIYQIGDVIEENNTLDDIWHSSKYDDFRQMHINNNLPEICKGCYK